jgi:hypothetical protein
MTSQATIPSTAPSLIQFSGRLFKIHRGKEVEMDLRYDDAEAVEFFDPRALNGLRNANRIMTCQLASRTSSFIDLRTLR